MAQKSADPTIARVIHLLNANEPVDADELVEHPALKAFADVWPQLVIKDALLKHCNERAITTRIVVPGIFAKRCSAHCTSPRSMATKRRCATSHNAPGVRTSAVTSLHS